MSKNLFVRLISGEQRQHRSSQKSLEVTHYAKKTNNCQVLQLKAQKFISTHMKQADDQMLYDS